MPRDRQLILGAYPCCRNFYSDGPQTVAELRHVGDQLCPFYDRCPVEDSSKTQTWCVMALGTIVAQFAIERGYPIVWLVQKWVRREITKKAWRARRFAWSPDREHLEILIWERDAKRILDAVRDFAVLTLEGSNDDPYAAYRITARRPNLEEAEG
jgi:hypothetical protein